MVCLISPQGFAERKQGGFRAVLGQGRRRKRAGLGGEERPLWTADRACSVAQSLCRDQTLLRERGPSDCFLVYEDQSRWFTPQLQGSRTVRAAGGVLGGPDGTHVGGAFCPLRSESHVTSPAARSTRVGVCTSLKENRVTRS